MHFLCLCSPLLLGRVDETAKECRGLEDWSEHVEEQCFKTDADVPWRIGMREPAEARTNEEDQVQTRWFLLLLL